MITFNLAETERLASLFFNGGMLQKKCAHSASLRDFHFCACFTHTFGVGSATTKNEKSQHLLG